MIDKVFTIIVIIILALFLISVYLGIREIIEKLREGMAQINEWKNKTE